MRRACRQVVDLAKVIMRAAEDGASGRCGSAEVAGDDSDDDGRDGDRCAKAMRAERASPVAVEHTFCHGALDAQLIAAMPTCTLTLLFVYSELVARKLWNPRFQSGKNAGAPVRSLATRHLHHPSTDGWNVVAGASALAHHWALSQEDLPRYPLDGACAFSKSTRVRLAVCLCIAWKFERSLSTHFSRQFYSAEPSLLSPHTHELAYVGYSFLLPHEQKEFGPWHPTNVVKIRELYDAMVALEVDLLNRVNVMVLLTQNVQVRAEDRIAKLLAANVFDAEAAMAIRSVVPLFLIASQDGRSMPPSEGALVCAAMLCMSVPTTVRAPVLHCHDTVCKQFTFDERRDAFTLLDQATHLKGLAVATLSSTCYVEEDWVHYPFVCSDALRIALFMAHDVSKQR